jgi:hypothetical protein
MRVFHLLVQQILFLLIGSFISLYCNFVNGQETKAYDEQHRSKTYKLLKANNIEGIEVQYWGERKLPYFNIWETLYFHLIKGEFELFFKKIDEYAIHISRSDKKDDLFYFNPRSIDDREYLFHNQTRDDLWDEVKRRISKRPNELFAKMSVTDLSLHEQDFIELFLYYMVWYFYRDEEEIDKRLESLIQSFKQKYPSATSEIKFIEKFVSNRSVKGKVRMMMDVGTDYTHLSNGLGDYISPNTGFTFSGKMLVGFRSVFAGIGVSVLDAKVQQAFNHEIPWTVDSTSNIGNFDFVMGYSYRMHKNFSIHPFLGYRMSSLAHRYTHPLDEDLNERIVLSSNAPLLGVYFDIEFMHNYWKKLTEPINRNSFSDSHYGLRLGVQYAFSNFGRHTPNLKGNMLLISLKLMGEFTFNSSRRRVVE